MSYSINTSRDSKITTVSRGIRMLIHFSKVFPFAWFLEIRDKFTHESISLVLYVEPTDKNDQSLIGMYLAAPYKHSTSVVRSISKFSCIGGNIRPSNSSKKEYLFKGIVTSTNFLPDVNRRLASKPVFVSC